MKQRLYSVYDKKAESFGVPFASPNDATAIRIVQNTARTPETNINMNPEDYLLYSVALFDMENGEVEPLYNMIVDVIQLMGERNVE